MCTLPSSVSTLRSLPRLQAFLAEHTPGPLPKPDADKFQSDCDFSGTERPGDGSVGNIPAITHGCTLPRSPAGGQHRSSRSCLPAPQQDEALHPSLIFSSLIGKNTSGFKFEFLCLLTKLNIFSDCWSCEFIIL